MIRKVLIALISVIFLVVAVYVSNLLIGSAAAQTEETKAADGGIDRYVDNYAFGVGEKLRFDIGYGFINAGYAIMEVADLVEYNGRPCYQVVSSAFSNKFFSSFFRVEDRVESIIDAVGIFSWHFEKHLQEGSYRSDRICEFDQVNHSVIYQDSTYEVAPYVQDALSIMYFARTQELKVGETIYMNNFTDGKNYPLAVKVHRRETIKVKAGKFRCLVVEPFLKTSGIFKHEGKLTVWLTDDRLKLPVLMKSKVLVGSISAELTEYDLGEIVEF